MYNVYFTHKNIRRKKYIHITFSKYQALVTHNSQKRNIQTIQFLAKCPAKNSKSYLVPHDHTRQRLQTAMTEDRYINTSKTCFKKNKSKKLDLCNKICKLCVCVGGGSYKDYFDYNAYNTLILQLYKFFNLQLFYFIIQQFVKYLMV